MENTDEGFNLICDSATLVLSFSESAVSDIVITLQIEDFTCDISGSLGNDDSEVDSRRCLDNTLGVMTLRNEVTIVYIAGDVELDQIENELEELSSS